MKFITASGDHTARLWTVAESRLELIREFNGHSRSVKSTAFRHEDPSVFSSGGRDGAILIWDIRAAINVGSMARADNIIYRGHAGGPGTPHAYKRRTRHQTPELPPNVSSSSITGLVFQDDNTLVSCGAGDGIIKVWDLRRNYSSYKREPLPKFSIPYPGTSTYKGYTSLLMDNDLRVRLYVNCMDNNIYCYNLATYSKEPIMRYTGLRNSTFYIKSSLSADGQYLLSGSSDEKAYIWNVNNAQPLLSLVGHSVEVTCVAWSHTYDTRLVTCSDDTRHKIWRIGPEHIELDEQQSYRGLAERCHEYRNGAGKLKMRLKMLENTPRSVRRLVERNETTPSTGDVIHQQMTTASTTSSSVANNKRTFMQMNVDDLYCHEMNGNDQKRPLLETRARRLFSPTIGGQDNGIHLRPIDNAATNLSAILEETDAPSTPPPFVGDVKLLTNSPTKPKLSPLSSDWHNRNQMRSPESMAGSGSSGLQPPQIFSPTSNLPNFVVTGEAPHLPAQSPKRKLKENVDWLTKIRKQKLMSIINSSQKLNGQLASSASTTTTGSSSSHAIECVTDESHDVIMSPRLQSLKASERHSAITTPKRRRLSHSDNFRSSPQHQRIQTNGRRNSEATILKFFTVTHSRTTTTTTSTQDSSGPTEPLTNGRQSTTTAGCSK